MDSVHKVSIMKPDLSAGFKRNFAIATGAKLVPGTTKSEQNSNQE